MTEDKTISGADEEPVEERTGDVVSEDDARGRAGESDTEDPFEPAADDDLDEGLAAQLKALREEDTSEPLVDAPLWAFDRAPAETQHEQQPRESLLGVTNEAAPSETAEVEGLTGDTADEQPAESHAAAAAAAVIGAGAALGSFEEAAPITPAPSVPVAVEGQREADSSAASQHVDDEQPIPEEPLSAQPSEDSAPADDGVSEDEPESDLWPEDEFAGAATIPDAVVVPEPRGIDMGPDRRGKMWAWAAAAIVLVILAGVGLYAWWWTTSRPVTVPDVVGKRPAEAVQAINDQSLRLGAVSEAPTSAAPPGTIIVQVPAAGAKLKPGDSVGFTLAAAPDSALVPDLTGTTKEDALTALANARLLPYVVSSYSPTSPVDAVVAQLPLGGVELPPGSTVAVVVSKGKQPATVVVPTVTGLNETEAVRLVNASNLSAVVYRSIDPSVSAGQATKQYPAAHTSVVPQSTVQILVSQGAGGTAVSVPNVMGKTTSSAYKALEKVKLKGASRSVPSTTVSKGKVISQMPPAGSKSAEGGVVGLLISTGNVTSSAVPSLVGTSSAQAEKSISAAGFKPFVIEIETADKPDGVVFAQFPSQGTQYPLRLPVVVLVARVPTP